MDAAAQRARVAGLFDQLSPGYDQNGVPWFTPIGARLVELTAPRPGDRALDVGAGQRPSHCSRPSGSSGM